MHEPLLKWVSLYNGFSNYENGFCDEVPGGEKVGK